MRSDASFDLAEGITMRKIRESRSKKTASTCMTSRVSLRLETAKQNACTHLNPGTPLPLARTTTFATRWLLVDDLLLTCCLFTIGYRCCGLLLLPSSCETRVGLQSIVARQRNVSASESSFTHSSGQKKERSTDVRSARHTA